MKMPVKYPYVAGPEVQKIVKELNDIVYKGFTYAGHNHKLRSKEGTC